MQSHVIQLGGRLFVGISGRTWAGLGASVVLALFGKGRTPQSGSWVEIGTWEEG